MFEDRYYDTTRSGAHREAREGGAGLSMQDMLIPGMAPPAPAPEAPKKKRKRGGLAGIWDRNKKIIKPVATLAAGALTGGAAVPALLGAAMGGLDREGKGGIGFDVGKGAMGAATGYGMGKLGAAGRGFFTPGSGAGAGATMAPPGADPSTLAMPGQYDPAGFDRVAGAVAPPAAPGMAPPAPTPGGGGGLDGLQDKLKGVLNFAKDNPAAIGSALQGAGSVLGARMEQDTVRERLAFEREREMEDRRRRAMMAQLLIPMYLQEQERLGLPAPSSPSR
jgi:hypothetical protein